MLQAAAVFAPFTAPFAAPFALAAGEAQAIADGIVSPAQAKHLVGSYGESWVYMQGTTGQLPSLASGCYRLKPGMSPHPPHSHPEEEIVLITEGAGEVSIEGKPAQVAAGSMMFCAAGRTHGIVNTGETPLTFYYWKWRK